MEVKYEELIKKIKDICFNDFYVEIKYLLDDVNIDIDSWPLIPTYAEIEGKSEEEVKKIIEKLEIDSSKITTMDVTSIYMEIYGIDILKIKNLEFKN